MLTNHQSEQTISANGEWVWGSWSPCSTSCGTGTRTRTASSCNGPFYGGLPCSGNVTDTGNCTGEHFLVLIMNHCLCLLLLMHLFADEGTWSTWDDWGTCSQSCGEGTQTRTRNYTSGQPCTGNSTDTQICPGKGENSLFIIKSSL